MLASTAADLKAGETDVPVGIVFPGPNGVGKTFIAQAFAKDSGLNCVSLKNFRGMYVGQTESNLELIFSILRSMTTNCVIVDEADKMLGNERGDAGSGVDERVFGALTAFMGDPAYRGKIFWLLLTARPFELAPDTGRPGRVEEHVPILPPETLEDRRSILLAVARARGVKLVGENAGEWSDAEYASFFDEIGTVTPAAIELMVNRARRQTRRALAHSSSTSSAVPVAFETMRAEGKNYVPDGTDSKLKLQTLEAVLYTNHLEYLPEIWRGKLASAPESLALERAKLRREVGYDES
jgi:SpoVK/Ycf46/Vps4 family AAA+-type ATPase